jgi:uncharacterized membrane protein YagU involved in acid resistance
MENANASKAIGAGFIATLVMTLMMYIAPMMGMPKMDIATMLGSMFTSGMPQPWSGAWWTGMIFHFINGTIIFPLIYAYLLYPFLAGSPWLRGTEWGLILWLLAQAMVMPMMGVGFFSANAPQPFTSVMGSLIGHIVYGAILGAIAGEQATRVGGAEHARYERRERHA